MAFMRKGEFKAHSSPEPDATDAAAAAGWLLNKRLAAGCGDTEFKLVATVTAAFTLRGFCIVEEHVEDPEEEEGEEFSEAEGDDVPSSSSSAAVCCGSLLVFEMLCKGAMLLRGINTLRSLYTVEPLAFAF